MAHRGERRPHRGVELGLERQLVRDLAVMKTRYVGRHLEVGAEIEDVDQRLSVTLRPHLAAHQEERHQRQIAVHDEAGRERVERSLIRRDEIG